MRRELYAALQRHTGQCKVNGHFMQEIRLLLCSGRMSILQLSDQNE